MKTLHILPFKAGFSALVRHTLGGFLLADILGRKPVVVWRGWCLYATEEEKLSGNAYRRFFEASWEEEEEEVSGDIFPNHENVPKALLQPETKYITCNFYGDNALPMDLNTLISVEEGTMVFAHYVEFWDVVQLAPDGHFAHGLGYHEALHRVASKYLVPKPAIVSRCDTLLKDLGKDYIAIHYRATDRRSQSGIASIKQTLSALQSIRKSGENVFIATDEEQALLAFNKHLGDSAFAFDIARSRTGKALHLDPNIAAKNGEDLLCDAIILSQSKKLIANPISTVVLLAASILRDPLDRNNFLVPVNQAFISRVLPWLKYHGVKLTKKLLRHSFICFI